MSFTREQWARDFLLASGNLNPSDNVVQWVVGWTVAETANESGSYTGATFNLLNTTLPASGATNFNSIGVKNYTSYSQGIASNASTVRETVYYPSLLAALVANDFNALNTPSPGVRSDLNTWCGSCGYGTGFYSLGIGRGGDSFSYGGATPVSPGSPPPTATGGSTRGTTQPVSQNGILDLGFITDANRVSKLAIGVLLITIGVGILAFDLLQNPTVQKAIGTVGKVL